MRAKKTLVEITNNHSKTTLAHRHQAEKLQKAKEELDAVQLKGSSAESQLEAADRVLPCLRLRKSEWEEKLEAAKKSSATDTVAVLAAAVAAHPDSPDAVGRSTCVSLPQPRAARA